MQGGGQQMVGRALFLQQNDQKVPGAVLIPEVVALELKLAHGACPSLPGWWILRGSLTSCPMSGC